MMDFWKGWRFPRRIFFRNINFEPVQYSVTQLDLEVRFCTCSCFLTISGIMQGQGKTNTLTPELCCFEVWKFSFLKNWKVESNGDCLLQVMRDPKIPK